MRVIRPGQQISHIRDDIMDSISKDSMLNGPASSLRRRYKELIIDDFWARGLIASRHPANAEFAWF